MSQPHGKETSEELLTRLIHRLARSTGAFRSTTQALLNGADEDPVLRRELLHDMEFELGELQRLFENVTQYKALEKGTFVLNRRELLTAPWLRQVISRWQRTLPEKTLAWVVDIPDSLPVVRVDVDKLEQGLNNLLGNAAKHSPPGAHIEVRAWSSDSYLRIRVSSSPSQLMQDDYDRLAGLFYTGEYQGRFPAGLGLGLYVTRVLVEQHSGTLQVVRPVHEDGSVGFELAIPAMPNAAQTNARRPNEAGRVHAAPHDGKPERAERSRDARDG